MNVLNMEPWDGVKTTGYTLKDTQYSRYFTKVTVDIRPGVIKRDVVTINSKFSFPTKITRNNVQSRAYDRNF